VHSLLSGMFSSVVVVDIVGEGKMYACGGRGRTRSVESLNQFNVSVR
jgi:hypothetical protein